MPLDAKLRRRLHEVLRAVDDHATTGPRLLDDAQRLWARLRKFIDLELVALTNGAPELIALELSAYALQLPLRKPSRSTPTGRPTKSTLRNRCEESAELLVVEFGGDVDAALLDQTARLLHEVPHRAPMLDEARLLADAINLEDFGVLGVAQQMIQLATQGQGVVQLSAGLDKREQYGYWEARLNEGFHFEPVRQIARKRLEHARSLAKLLREELNEDQL